jgi:GxxExxY protein
MMHPLYEKAHNLTDEVIAAAVEVHKHFGPGVLESIYVKCLEQALKCAGHTVEREKIVTISYMGASFDEKLRCDLLVDDCLIIEAKSIEPCDLQRFRMQLLSYMKLLDKPLGLVMNFGEERFGKRGIRRVILKGADEGFDPFKL